MFWIGITIISITLILLLTVKEDISLGAMGILGICLITTSKYRLLKSKKK